MREKCAREVVGCEVHKLFYCPPLFSAHSTPRLFIKNIIKMLAVSGV